MANDEDFRYKFGTPMPGLDSKVTTALQDNFRRAATQKYVATQTGLLIPKSIIDAKGDLIVGTGADTPVRKAVGSNGSLIEAASSEADGLKWQAPVRGIIVPNAAVGTNVTQPAFPGSVWARMYGITKYKAGDYFQGATLVNHADGALYIQIDVAGLYLFELAYSGTRPVSSEVGYGITTKALFDAGLPYRDAHNHEKPYDTTSDYKTRTFQRYCAVGDLVAPLYYFSGATGNIIHFNQPQSMCHFSFVRVAA